MASDDTAFLDDDLDALPLNALEELESNAIQYTQQQGRANAPSSDYGGFEDDELEEAEVIDQSERNIRSGPDAMVIQRQTISGENTSGQSDQLQLLLKENATLRQSLSTRNGEIAIIRTKQEKARKEFEQEHAVSRKINDDIISKQQRIIEASRDAERRAATELEFMRRDLAEEAEKSRNLRNATKHSVTPKKPVRLAHRDGFNSDDVQVISPIGRRSNHGTPTKGKRKRKGQESPIAALDFQVDDAPVETPLHDTSPKKRDDRYEFFQSILYHHDPRRRLSTIEEFTAYSFPSSPNETISSLILDQMRRLGSRLSGIEFGISFSQFLIILWRRCLKENFFKPIGLLIEFLEFSVEQNLFRISPHVIDDLLPVAQTTGDLIAVPRYEERSPPEAIDLSACLDIMCVAAIGCVADRTRYWKMVRQDFVLMLLSPRQNPKDVELMLRLLSMSSLAESFGPILNDAKSQRDQANYIIHKMTLALVSTPPLSDNQYINILGTLDEFCQSPWGGETIARHSHAIGRIVLMMSRELDALYYYSARHEQRTQIINKSIRLLYHLVTTYDEHIDMQKKLSAVHGGVQRYQVCLARLAYYEDDIIMEQGIEPEVAECAHEMLEMIVTPEEGDAIHEAFGGTQI